MGTIIGNWNFENPVLENVIQYKQAAYLSFDELVFIDAYGKRNRGYANVVLPYELDVDRKMVDSIAKKMKMNKFFRGVRANSRARRGNVCRTLKEDAVAVALYRKYDIKEN